jgi:hypothetical protein
MVSHNTNHPVLRGCVNLCTLTQTANLPVPSMGPHPRDYTGVPTHVVVLTLRPPPIPTQVRATHATRPYPKVVTQQHPNSALRVSTKLDSQLQKTVVA